eukprot:TRINITY_DN4187_c0_g1_i1.p1 TRINITY_DN4187_c0_g1~~TRINITY_DN4187_c0_g1_i1.p1  ORF type:complete len:306 (-),score=50.93 TRINITY_DN4187_c0_g1_i1:47-964(-)
MKVVSGMYYGEQILILSWGLLAVVSSSLQIRLQKRPENSKDVKLIQFIFMRSLLVAGTLETIWGIDPRGIWNIYPALFLAFLKDFILITAIGCGVLWIDVYCRVLLETQGRVNVSFVSEWLTTGLVNIAHLISEVIPTIVGFKLDSQSPRSVYLWIAVTLVFIITAGATLCLSFVKRIRDKAGVKMRIEQQRFWNRMVVIVSALWLCVVMAYAMLGIGINAYKDYSFSMAHIEEDPAVYHPYPFLLFHVLSLLIVYILGKLPIKESHARAAAATPVITPGVSRDKKDSIQLSADTSVADNNQQER